MLDIIFKKANGLPHIPTTYNVKFCSDARPLVKTEVHRVQAREQRLSQKAHARREKLSLKRMRARCASVG
jgi:hypothetical protein